MLDYSEMKGRRESVANHEQIPFGEGVGWYTLEDGRWRRGGLHTPSSRTIALYDKDENGIFQRIGTGIY